MNKMKGFAQRCLWWKAWTQHARQTLRHGGDKLHAST